MLVLTAPGINCDRETALALALAGATTETTHINDLTGPPELMRDFRILALSGGFSFGDDIASGRVLARKLRDRLGTHLAEFTAAGKLILGICNGFQVLVKLGVLPALPGEPPGQQASLTFNTSDKFEDRWTYLEIDQGCNSVFTRGIDSPIYLPVRHGEGRFIPKDDAIAAGLQSAGQIALRYVDESGQRRGYPINPNGSVDNIAGISDPTGRIFGLMPHPEVFVSRTQHPRWTREEVTLGDGLRIFQNGVEFAASNL